MNVYFLLDRSGSMENIWDEALGSINGYVDGLPVTTKITLAAFDNLSYDIVSETTAKLWKNITRADIDPRGGTPLYDSAARMMQRALEDNPEKAIFVVMTDGEENSSRNFTQADVKNLVSQLTAKKWEVIFLGANFDKVGVIASGFGVKDVGKFMNIKKGSLSGAMRGFAEASTAYASASVGEGAIMFNEDDKAKAGGDSERLSATAKKLGMTEVELAAIEANRWHSHG